MTDTYLFEFEQDEYGQAPTVEVVSDTYPKARLHAIHTMMIKFNQIMEPRESKTCIGAKGNDRIYATVLNDKIQI